ncbi:MAG: 5-oxoprolinase subunit PxpB, partial [Candidatus Methylomirabilaceae bacterium]
SCLVVELGDRIDPAVNQRVRALALAVERAGLAGVREAVPTYRSLAVYYDPLKIERGAIQRRIDEFLGSAQRGEIEEQARIVEIPTIYGGEYGPDLAFLAQHAGLQEDEVIRLHAEPLYHVYMLGFAGGFPYLGGLSGRLAVPRLSTPRLRVPAGSVGIGGMQTGVYPVESPGGWRIIGRTFLRLFDPGRQPPALVLPGHKVRFVPLTEEGALTVGGAVRPD